MLKQKLLYSITFCTAIDADYDRDGALVEEDANPADELDAHPDQSAESENGGPRDEAGLFANGADDYGASDVEGWRDLS